MPKRFLAEDQLCFSVEGRPVTKGNASDSAFRGKDDYIRIIKLGAKMAVAEQKWKLTEDGVYVVIVIYIDIGKTFVTKETKKQMLKNDKILATKEPRATVIARHVMDAITGVVFKSIKQVVGITVVKKYSQEPRIEILVGKPKDYRELSNDLRNA